jgi:hypothetical protein
LAAANGRVIARRAGTNYNNVVFFTHSVLTKLGD